MIFEHNRFEIWNALQHPLKHTLAEFLYTNPALPGVLNVEQAIGWIVSVLYPNAKAAVANPAALPLLGNTLNDYRVVLDDGDGKAAAYRWEQREGDVSAQWYKSMDMDWSTDSIIASFMDVAQDLFVVQRGKQDLDAAGAVVTGLYAGQKINGGTQSGQNLTLRANSGDGLGPNSGFVQVDDDFRPTIDNAFDLATATERFANGFFAASVVIGTLTLSPTQITNTSGLIDFDNENLETTGNIDGNILTASNALVVDDLVDTITIIPGSISDTTGAITFGSADLTTTGALNAGITTITDGVETLIIDPDVAGVCSIVASTGVIDFGTSDLNTTGDISATNLYGGNLEVDNVSVNGNTISILNVNGNLILSANGTGVIDAQSALTTLGITATGVVGITGQLNVDNIRVDANTISSTNLNGDISLSPNGTGSVITSGILKANADASLDIGEAVTRFKDLFLSGNISDGTDNIALSTLLAFRSGVWRDLAQTLPAQAGDILFFDAVNNVWLANHPDTEILHSEVSGLTTGDAGHTQFAMLAGRAGGQTLIGGTAASENLLLQSTSHATRGVIQIDDDLEPLTNASYSGSWSGIDLGGPSKFFRDLYMRGEAKNLRLENYTFATLPTASVSNIGRVVYATDQNKAYIDTGTAFKVFGVSKFAADQAFDGIILLLNVDVSAEITDARNAMWQLRDNANNFEIMGVTILATSASNVRITTNIPLPAGSYRLIGVE